MNAAMYKALSGSLVQMMRLEVTAQNLANINTNGYKSETLTFREILTDVSAEGDPIGGLVVVDEQRLDLSPGPLEVTGNPLDLALEGEVYFAIETAQGERYSRLGAFTRSADGTLVTSLGQPLLGEGGPIQIDGTRIDITLEGTVMVDGAEVDRLRLVQFPHPDEIIREGNSLLRVPDAEPAAPGSFRVIQGSLEKSNVNPIQSMVELIDIQRQFEAYQRALRVMDETTEKVLDAANT